MANVTTQDKIEADHYNSLYQTIYDVLGPGEGSYGYGQSLHSSLVNNDMQVSAEQMENLRKDINRAYLHQFNSTTTLGIIETGDMIGADASGPDPTNLTELDKGHNDYNSAVLAIYENALLLGEDQSSIELALESTRTTPWNTEIIHQFSITFDDYNHRRYFFNSGGEIRITAELSGSTLQDDATSKDYNWAQMLSNMQTIIFSHSGTTNTGASGTAANIGHVNLPAGPDFGVSTKIFEKFGTGDFYTENSYTIYARQPTEKSNIIYFKIVFVDQDSGDPPIIPVPEGGSPTGVDENVLSGGGSIRSTIRQRRATEVTPGTSVEVATPSYAIIQTL